ncbi:hypothetical protein GCM10009609_07010 [Pseudonocardia aurantiaca]|uniref:Uncharacterized protein n=1 Tax=Pseudonocardia aurantiaca TaxID=75290 RepID=A0ABW4FM41_9PSEU
MFVRATRRWTPLGADEVGTAATVALLNLDPRRGHAGAGKLLDNTVSRSGVVMGTYEPAGELVTGSFALD